MLDKKNKFFGRCRVSLIAVLVFLLSLTLGQSALALSPALTVSGTLADGATEQEVQAGNQTIVLTLQNATFTEDVVSNETKRDALLTGLAAGRLYNEAYAGTGLLTGDLSTYDKILSSLDGTKANDQLEWAEVINVINADSANIALNEYHTQVTITIPAVAGYDIFLNQTIQVTVPDDVLVGAAADLTAAKPFLIDAVLGTLSWNGQNENDIVNGGKVITVTTTWSGGFANKAATLTSAGGKQTAFIDYFEAQSETDQWAKVKDSLYDTAGAVVRAPDGMSVTVSLQPVADYNITNVQQIRYYFATGLIGQTGGGTGGTGASFPIGIAVPLISIDTAGGTGVLDTTPIDTAINAANVAKTGVVISTDGTDVLPGTYWVTQEVNDALDAAIATAIAAKGTVTTALEVTNAAAKLDTAVSIYNAAKNTDSNIDITLPSWPAQSVLSATYVTKNTLTLTWPAAMDNLGVTAYKIYKDSSVIDNVYGHITTYNVTGLSANTQYTFQVQAGDAADNWSTDGPITKITTSGSGGDAGNDDTQAPTWPNKTFKKASKLGDTSVVLEWYAATDNVGVTGYNIYHGTELIGSVNGNTTTFTCALDLGSSTGQQPYIVQAVDAAGNESTDGPYKVLGGTNLPLIYEYGFFRYYPDSNTTKPDELIGKKTSPPWEIKDVPCTFTNNQAIGLKFSTNVTTNKYYNDNKAIIKMYDASSKSISIKVDRAGDGSSTSASKNYIFVIPQVTLEPGTTYNIIVGPTLTSNNGMQAGEEQEVFFTTKGSTAASSGGDTITTDGPTYTNGSGSVDPDVGATVGLNDIAEVVIPADALKGSSSVKVNIKKVTSPPAAPAGFKVAGDVYEFSVGDKTSYSFAKNVALTFKFDASKIGADEVPAIYYYDETQKKWVNIGGTVSGSTITVQVDHFTKYIVFAVKKTEAPVEQPTVPVEQPSVALNDIAGHWAQSNIERLVSLGAVSGYTDGSFKPGKIISRAEFAAILVKAFKLTAGSGKSFTDTAGHWAKNDITTAVACGIVNGYDEDTFGPNDPITREQMAAMIVNAAKLSPATGEIQFADSGNVSGWAQKSIVIAVKNGIMKGYPDNKFLPRGNATRAEAVTVIVNALK